MNFKNYLFYFVFSLSTQSSQAIVNGVAFANDEISKPQPYVSLLFDLKGLPTELCTATYLGDGNFLTAAHCFILNEYENFDLVLTIENSSKLNKLKLSKADYDLFFAPVIEWGGKAPTRKTHTVVRIPKPDIVIIKLKKQFKDQLPPLDKVNLVKTSTEDSALLNFKIIGQGCTGYISFGQTMSGQGVFRIAPVQLENFNSEIEVLSIWNPTNLNSGVCWGDSGGALMVENKENPNEQLQFGVISAMRTKHDATTGEPAIVTSQYGRLDSSVIQEWLKQTLN